MDTLHEAPAEPPVMRVPWLTHRRIIFFVIGWLALFSAASVFVANPFASETSASATPDYWRVMYLHALLIGLVGLLALLTCQIFRLRSRHVRVWIALGVIVATVATGVGGIFDKRIPGAEVAMWTQIVGFFALDEILVVFLIGMIGEWRRGSAIARTLTYWAAWLAAASMLVAAIMGHVAGWIMEFGALPAAIGTYARHLGISLGDFTGGLVGAHSHDMVVAVMALTIALAAQQFGLPALKGAAHAVGYLGMWMVAIGTVAMTALYVVMGVRAWEPPAMFTSAGGTNGVASDDILTGIFVMGGGVLVMAAVLFARAAVTAPALRRPVRIAATWAWVLSFATVVVAGYAIELNETYFGAGDKAPGAAKDAVFTWLHQDIGLFLLPAVVVLMMVVERLVMPRFHGAIGWLAFVGTSVLFLGAMIFVFVSPALHGAGYVISTIGLLVVGLAITATMWWGTIGGTRAERLEHAAEPSSVPRAA